MRRRGGVARWLDDGIAFKVELATDGQVILTGNRTDKPFNSGGTSGVPQGWTPYNNGQSWWNQITYTTDTGLNRFSISATASSGVGYYGATINLLTGLLTGHSYRVGVSVRTMDGKQAGGYRYNVVPFKSGAQVAGTKSVLGDSSTDWQPLIAVMDNTAGAFDTLRVDLLVDDGTQDNTTTFGVQWSVLYVIDDPPVAPLTWRDITCDVKGLNVRYGREQFTQRYDIATMQLTLDNDDGSYSYHDHHPFNLRPGRQVRASVTYQGTAYPLFYGVIDSLNDGYGLEGDVISSVVAYDPQYLFANQLTPTLPVPDWTVTYLSGLRINELLDAAGYKPRAIDAGQFTQQRVQASGSSVRDTMGIGADSEGGSLFADRTGQMVYKDRTWLTTDNNLTKVTANLRARPEGETLYAQDTVPTQGTAPEVCVRELITAWSTDRVINHVELANAGGTMQAFDDKTSQGNYGVKTYQRMDYVNTLSTTLPTRANDIMAGFSDAKVRVNSISYRPAVDGDSWVWTLTVFLNWLVRIYYGNPQTLWGYSVVTHVQAIEHRITPKDWETKLTLDQPIAYNDYPIRTTLQDHWQVALWENGHWQDAKFTEWARFNMAFFERGPAVFDTAKFDRSSFQ